MAAAGLADRVTVHGGSASGVGLPERVDVCVSEVIGTIGSSEGAAAVFADARERFLRPGGASVPARCTTMAAAVTLDPVLWISLECGDGGEPVDSLRHPTSWLPVVAPLADAGGIPVEPGDELDLEWRATLSHDGRHPDYAVSGAVHRPGRDDVPVAWVSHHHAPVFRASVAYRTLFPAGADT